MADGLKIKCSSCAADIDIMELADHICVGSPTKANAPASPTLARAATFDSYPTKSPSYNQPSPSNYVPYRAPGTLSYNEPYSGLNGSPSNESYTSLNDSPRDESYAGLNDTSYNDRYTAPNDSSYDDRYNAPKDSSYNQPYTSPESSSYGDNPSSQTRSGRMPPPARIDSVAANKPFMPQNSQLTPGSSYSHTQNLSYSSPGYGRPKPQVTRSATSPLPQLAASPAPPSPEFQTNMDSAFPPFPTTRNVKSPDMSRSTSKPETPTYNHQYAQASPLYAPVSPRIDGGEKVSKRMDSIAPGPFDGGDRRPGVMSGRDAPGPRAVEARHQRTGTQGSSKSVGRVANQRESMASTGSRTSTFSSRSIGLPTRPKVGPGGAAPALPPAPPKDEDRSEGIDAFLTRLRNETVAPSQDGRSGTYPSRQASKDSVAPFDSRPPVVDPYGNGTNSSMRADTQPLLEPRTYGNNLPGNPLRTPSDSGLSDDSYSSGETGSRSVASSRSSPPVSESSGQHSRNVSKIGRSDYITEDPIQRFNSPESFLDPRTPPKPMRRGESVKSSRAMPPEPLAQFNARPLYDAIESPMDPAIQKGLSFEKRPAAPQAPQKLYNKEPARKVGATPERTRSERRPYDPEDRIRSERRPYERDDRSRSQRRPSQQEDRSQPGRRPSQQEDRSQPGRRPSQQEDRSRSQRRGYEPEDRASSSDRRPYEPEDRSRSRRRGYEPEEDRSRSQRRGYEPEEDRSRSQRRGFAPEEDRSRSQRRGFAPEEDRSRSQRRGYEPEDRSRSERRGYEPEDRSRSSDRRPAPVSRGKCKGCSKPITGKSVKDSSGRLTGRYHKECFTCRTCDDPFPTADFYVFQNHPYCEQHYHELNDSLCQLCNRGIEGQYLETDAHRKYHPACFTCSTCRIPLRDDYFEVDGRTYCERHVHAAARSGSSLAPGYNGSRNIEKRRTRLMMM